MNGIRVTTIISKMIRIYIRKRVSRSAAELAYFLTMSVFPMLICLNYIAGSVFPDMDSVMTMAEGIIPSDTLVVISEYMSYVSRHNDVTMLTAGLLLMASSAASAFRSLNNIMGDIQGKTRFTGFLALVISFLCSLILLAAMYFSAAVVITGNWFINFIEKHFVYISLSGSWEWVRFVLLFVILMSIMYGIYRFTAPKNAEHSQLPGAIAAAISIVIASMIFSWFIGLSVRYPLVYGSLASLIILMLWLYLCSNIIIMGNVFNVVLSEQRNIHMKLTDLNLSKKSKTHY